MKRNGRSSRKWPRKKKGDVTSFDRRAIRLAAALPLFVLSATNVRAEEVVPSSPTVAVQDPTVAPITMLHPTEGAKLPFLKEVFVYGAVPAGASLAINGSTVPVHAKGGYLTMVPLVPGENLLRLETTTFSGESSRLERKFTVNAPPVELPRSPVSIVKDSILPAEDALLAPGDTLRISFQGSPQATAEFDIEGLAKRLPMVEVPGLVGGFYEGTYVVPREGSINRADITVSLRRNGTKHEKARGHLGIDIGAVPRVGLITEDTVAARTAANGGYDVFLYKGMRVQLTGKIGSQWRVRLSNTQSGWVKDSAIQELPRGTSVPQAMVSNMKVIHEFDSTIIQVPLSTVLPFRVEQSVDPMAITVTLYGAANKTDLIRYDPADPLIRLIRWRQVSPDACQLVIEPRFKKWWGFDVRYEGSMLIIEVREPWLNDSLRNMVIAVDAGHGGSDRGAVGPRGSLEKEANLAIAKVVVETLEKSGAKPFLTRTDDSDLPLYERTKMAWRNKARLFISVHCNSSGLWENPLWNNGSSVYFYQPQSQGLAESIHAGYRKHVPMLPDRGLYYADFAVCRMTQMPAVLTEQAYIIVPEQEGFLTNPAFQQNFANAIVNGIKNFLKK